MNAESAPRKDLWPWFWLALWFAWLIILALLSRNEWSRRRPVRAQLEPAVRVVTTVAFEPGKIHPCRTN